MFLLESRTCPIHSCGAILSLLFKKMFPLVAGGVVLPLCGEDKDHRELLHGRLWFSSRQAGWRSSSHSAVCFCLSYISSSSSSLICVCLPQTSMNEWNHLSELVLFALAMQQTLKEVNRHSAKNFQLRVGKWLSRWPHTLTPVHTHTLTTYQNIRCS